MKMTKKERAAWERGKADAVAAVRTWAAARLADEARGGMLCADGTVFKMLRDGVSSMYAEGAQNAAIVVERDLKEPT